MNLKIKQGTKTYASLPVTIKGVDKENFSLEAIFSTQDEDRHGDVVMQDGWDLGPFKKNPVIINSHNYGDAAEVIGRAVDVRVENKKLQGTIIFAVNENPKAKVIFDLYAGGFLKAFSVGFIVKKFKQNKDGSVDWWNIEEAELLEVSAVSVPANARALAKAKGIDTDVLENAEEEADEETPAEEKEEQPEAPTDEEPKEAEPEPTEQKTDEPETTVEEPSVVKASYNTLVVRAIKNIEIKEKVVLKTALSTIKAMLGDEDIKGLDKTIGQKVRKRKINQTIRSLMKLK